ncbi:KilA N domain protein [Finch poxvirus]|uniref:KilA N domain protein n=2 Tax=unclassified Avipoxvirus TaxID=336487 RepID=A0AAT9UQL9_9POXV|nr:KilA N domain protein [Finch poxvirus]UOX38972.1 KilA N domain protein [Finch poxvirus]
MDFSNLVTREIDERFCYIKYDQFNLIMMKENNYINATKLCKLGGKEFKKWVRLEGSKELIKTVEEANNYWKIKSSDSDLNRMILEVKNEYNIECQYEVAGYYVHPDLLPHICSWISPFAIKVSKIINCYMSGQYEFKLKEKEREIKEKETTNKELLELLYAFDKKYDRDIADLKERYKEQKRDLKEQNKELAEGMKRMEEKYDRDTRELKEYNKRIEEKYDRDTRELKLKIERIEERLKDKVINPTSPNKLHRLVILQNKKDPNSFRTLRVQVERMNQEINKVKQDYNVFFNAYEPNAVSCFNNLKERLISQERVKVNYNDFTLCDSENYGVRELCIDLLNLDLVRKYT